MNGPGTPPPRFYVAGLFPEERAWLDNLKAGDVVVRHFCGCQLRLQVTQVTDFAIECGSGPDGYTFDRRTAEEIDEALGWMAGHSGAWIRPEWH